MSKPTLDENISLLQSLIPHVKQLEARIAELEAECDQARKERDEWQEQCEETFKTMKALEQELANVTAELEAECEDKKHWVKRLTEVSAERDQALAMAERLAEALEHVEISEGPLLGHVFDALAEYREWKGKA